MNKPFCHDHHLQAIFRRMRNGYKQLYLCLHELNLIQKMWNLEIKQTHAISFKINYESPFYESQQIQKQHYIFKNKR